MEMPGSKAEEQRLYDNVWSSQFTKLEGGLKPRGDFTFVFRK